MDTILREIESVSHRDIGSIQQTLQVGKKLAEFDAQ